MNMLLYQGSFQDYFPVYYMRYDMGLKYTVCPIDCLSVCPSFFASTAYHLLVYCYMMKTSTGNFDWSLCFGVDKHVVISHAVSQRSIVLGYLKLTAVHGRFPNPPCLVPGFGYCLKTPNFHCENADLVKVCVLTVLTILLSHRDVDEPREEVGFTGAFWECFMTARSMCRACYTTLATFHTRVSTDHERHVSQFFY